MDLNKTEQVTNTHQVTSRALCAMDSTAQKLFPDGEQVDESLALRERLESLPQELYNEIYNLTFTARKNVVTVNDFSNYRPPARLHVDRLSRKKFMRSYYRETTFIFVSEYVFARWKTALKHVPNEYFRFLYITPHLDYGLLWRERSIAIRHRWLELGSSLRIITPCSKEIMEFFMHVPDLINIRP